MNAGVGDTQSRSDGRSLSRRDAFMTVLAAYTLAVGLPVVDLLRQNVAFFVAHDALPLDTVMFIVAITLFIPALVGAVTAAMSPAWLRVSVHVAAVAVLLASFASQLIERVPGWSLGPWVVVGVAAAIGLAAALAISRLTSVRQFFRYLGWAPLLLIALFLLTPAVRGALAPDAAAGKTVEVAGSKSVVVVVFDELPVLSLMGPDGDLNRERYPNFARLADMTTWYRDASTAANSTIEAVPSLLTGRYPRRGTLPIFNHHMENLFTLFSGSHQVVASETMTRLCPARVCGEREMPPARERLFRLGRDGAFVALHVALPEALTGFLPPVDDRWASFGSEGSDRQGFLDEVITPGLRGDRRAEFEDFVARLSRSESPTLYFHHSMVPHRPWRYLPDGSEYPGLERVPGQTESVWSGDDWLVTQGLQRHLLQTGTTDHMIGALLDRLEDVGMIEDTILVVTADHGVAFDPEKPMRVLDEITTGSILAVPLFISVPGAEGTVVDEPVELVDVLPTLAGLLGATVDDWNFEGQSVLDPPDQRPRLLYTWDGTTEIEELAANRDAVLPRLDQRVPMSGTWDDLFRAGPHHDLLGSAVTDMAMGSEGQWRALLDNAGAYQQVAIVSRVLPVLVAGRLEGPPVPEGGVDLVVALNGTIVAVTRTFDQAMPSMFSALVPMSALSAGDNEVEVFVLEEGGSLSPLEVRPAGSGTS